MEPEVYINKIKDNNIEKALRILAERVRRLQGRVAPLEVVLGTTPGSAGVDPVIFYQQVENESGLASQQGVLFFENAVVGSTPAENRTYIAPTIELTAEGDGVTTGPFWMRNLIFRSELLEGLIEPDGFVVFISPNARGLREISGPNELVMGAVADGEFLKRVGGNIVGSAGGGGGEVNTASNVNITGIGVFKQKTGVNLEFFDIDAGITAAIAVTFDALNNVITIDAVVATTTSLGVVELATNGENAPNVVVQGNDGRLSDARTPTAHKISHQDTGTDEINVGGLSGLLADQQTPLIHDIITKHNGFPGGTTNFLRADGSFATPPAGAGGNTLYKPGDTTIATGNFMIFAERAEIGAAETMTIEGDATLLVI